MAKYANTGGDSGITSFEVDVESIIVNFKDGSSYLYNYDKPSKTHVEQMKTFARAGQGLNSYISRVIKKNYAAKLK